MKPEDIKPQTPDDATEVRPHRETSASASLAPGEQFGQYTILTAQGAGGMGEVYRARDTKLGREVAIKILPRTTSVDPSLVQRFESEARSASALNHPNIVTIYELGTVDSIQYIAMEFVNGKTLRELIRSGPMPMHRVITVASQLADGLARAHEAGIVHRDLKPENVMVRDDGLVKILDFGLAKLFDDTVDTQSDVVTKGFRQTQSGMVLGTLGYMSPQQALGEQVDFRSDQFSFGLVVYEMATGRGALKRKNGVETVAALLNEQPEPLGVLNPEAPAPLCWAIENCLAKDPEKRYASTRDLARELATIREHFSELRSSRVETPTTKLPRQLTPFVGRGAEVLALKEILLRDNVPLTTITGPGGVGKTRLSLKVAEELSAHFPAGVHLVQLGTVTDPNLVPSLIAQTLHIRKGAESPLETVKEYLRGSLRRPLLLVLDNFEQLLAGAPMLGELLSIGRFLKVLVTSRAPLHVYGEHEFPMPPLTLPDPRAKVSVANLPEYSAIALFLQRAAAVKPDFALTEENAADVLEICRRLDGLPLAIELAASRIKLLQPAALRTRLASRLRILTGGSRDLPARQQTLRGAIDWSHDFLNEAEQTLFRRLAVFAGGCHLEEVEAVCNTKEDLDLDLLDGMAALVNQSLVQQIDHPNGEARFAMLETIREYALEKLVESGEEAQTRKAHAAYCLVLAEEGASENDTVGRDDRFDTLQIEHENLRAALEWLIESRNEDWGLRLGIALFGFWEAREYLAEGRDRLEKLLQLNPDAPSSKNRARALFSLGALSGEQRAYGVAQRWIEASLEMARELNDKHSVAVSLNALAIFALDSGNIDLARTLLEESLVLWKECHDRLAVARSLSNLANVLRLQGEFARARVVYQDSMETLSEMGDHSGAAWSLNSLGDIAKDEGDLVNARSLYDKSLEAFTRLGDRLGVASSLADLGNIAREEGDYNLARSLYRKSLRIFRDLDHKRGVSRLFDCLACLAAAQSMPERSLKLAGCGAALRETLGVPLTPRDQTKLEKSLEPARRALSIAEGSAIWLEGWALPFESALDQALNDNVVSDTWSVSVEGERIHSQSGR